MLYLLYIFLMSLVPLEWAPPLKGRQLNKRWGDHSDIHTKYFIGYLYIGSKTKPLHVMLPKTNAYVKGYDGQTKWMYFLI